MINNSGKIVTHKPLLKEIWGNSYIGQNQYVRVYMAQLRQKIELDPGRPKILITEVGIGYRLKV